MTPLSRFALRAFLMTALAVLAARGAAPAQPGHGAPAAALRAQTAEDGLPRPFGLSLLAAVLSGVAGAATAERLGGARAPTTPGAVLETLVVGSVSAVALLGVNPPGGAWSTLAGTAAAGGLAGRALLLANANARRALAAELARDAADEGSRRVAVLAGEQLETLRRLAVDGGGMIGSGTQPDEAWERTLDLYAGRARVELTRVARRETAPPRPAADGAVAIRLYGETP
ncbi:MAG TPA: hypothetical protein VFJ82_23360 [Longimicrobium sp.]|nr:hypothetical protein [Longimicrobium sp.]